MKQDVRARRRSPCGASLSFLVIVLGCSSKDDTTGSASSQFHSRVDESKALGALTPDEQTTLCQDVASWTATLTKDPAYITGLCTLQGISAASLAASSNNLSVDQMRQQCQANESQCVNAQNTAMQMPMARGCAYPAACTATVSDLRDCTVGTFQGNLDLYATLPSCDAMQTDSVSKIDYSIATKAVTVCKKVTACGLPT